MKNFIFRFIVIGILSATALFAEESGWFAGAQFSSGSVELEYEYCGAISGTKECYTDAQEQPFEGYQWGLLGGYKQFFTPKFGLRYYASFNVGKNYSYDGTAYNSNDRSDVRTTFTNKLDEYTFHLHIDALYNFITSERSDFGVFAGVGLGYAFYKYTMTEGTNQNFGEQGYKQIDTVRDFDISIFLGLRVNLAKRHGIELYSRFTSLLTQEETFAVAGRYSTSITGVTLSNAPKTTIGIRYVFSF